MTRLLSALLLSWESWSSRLDRHPESVAGLLRGRPRIRVGISPQTLGIALLMFRAAQVGMLTPK
jgi:hypothetical protein